MQRQTLRFPIYVKLPLVLISIYLLFLFIYLGQQILIPLVIALLIAVLLNPFFTFLKNKLHFHKFLAVSTTVISFIILFLCLVYFITWQVSDVAKDADKIQTNLNIYADKLMLWIKDNLGFSQQDQHNFLTITSGNIMNGSSKFMGYTFSKLSGSLLNTILVPVYIFLVILYKDIFIKFLYKMVKNVHQSVLKDILSQVNHVLKGYIVGLLIQMLVVGILTTAGLMLLGVQYAILIGLITALLNLIPYIGIMTAIIIASLATLIHSNDPFTLVGVIVLFAFVQLIDNNILIPRIVGNKVKINALASIVGVIAGGVIAGIAGMFLAIPLLAIVKVIFDRIESLSPWGFLLGAEKNKKYNWPLLGKLNRKRLNKRSFLHKDNDDMILFL
jgi:predicted PurR-regulated permease PerM